MLSAIAPVSALLLSVAVLQVGVGLWNTLLPIRANLETFPILAIGALGTAYFLGFGAGCYFGGRGIRRAGHIRTFVAMASIASAVALAHALVVDPYVWALLRAITGFCFALMYMVAESWLNERTANDTRGRVFAVYHIINLTVMTGGQFMLTLYEPSAFPLFALISIMVSLAVVPLAMTAAPGPAPVEVVRLRLGYLYSISPVGCIGILAVGLVNSSFFSLAPVFAQESGIELSGIALFMGAAIVAGALSQWPLGHASDRTDRRNVIVAACLAGCLAGVALTLVNEVWAPGILVSAFVFGAFAFPLYSLCMAHSNDFVAREDFVGAASGLLLLYAIGATIGPALAAVAMSAVGTHGLFAFTALVHGSLAVFVLVRRAVRAAPGPEAKDDFVGVPRTTPTVFALDPRSEDDPAPESP